MVYNVWSDSFLIFSVVTWHSHFCNDTHNNNIVPFFLSLSFYKLSWKTCTALLSNTPHGLIVLSIFVQSMRAWAWIKYFFCNASPNWRIYLPCFIWIFVFINNSLSGWSFYVKMYDNFNLPFEYSNVIHFSTSDFIDVKMSICQKDFLGHLKSQCRN